MAIYRWVYDYACASRWGVVVAAYHWAHDYAVCHLQAACRVRDQLSSPTLDLLVWVYHYLYLFDADYRPVA